MKNKDDKTGPLAIYTLVIEIELSIFNSGFMSYILATFIDGETLEIKVNISQCEGSIVWFSLILLWTIEHTMKHLSINATFRPSRASSGIQIHFFCMPDEARTYTRTLCPTEVACLKR